MITATAFRIFLTCLLICAPMVLGGIWLGEHAVPEIYFKVMASLFVIGLASFLVWFSRTVYAIHELLASAKR